VQWVEETSLWVGKSLTRPDEVSVLNKAAGLGDAARCGARGERLEAERAPT